MSLGNDVSINTFAPLSVTVRKMCLQYSCKMISHFIYFYPFIVQVFLAASPNPLWIEAEYEF